VEDEEANLPLDWRKKVAFKVELQPSQMTKVDCRFKVIEKKEECPELSLTENYIFDNGDMLVEINTKTGHLDRYEVNGKSMISSRAVQFLVIKDDEDAWGTDIYEFREVIGSFQLLSQEESSKFAGVHQRELSPIRIIESGAARVTVEVLLGYGDSRICLRYQLPRHGTEIGIEAKVHWNEKQRFLKCSIPTVDTASQYHGQVAYGHDRLFEDGREAVAQRWVMSKSTGEDAALSIISDSTYGSDFKDGEIRLSMLRSPAYSGMNLFGRQIMKQDRYSPRIDQGERHFKLWIKGSGIKEREENIERESISKNESPMALSFFPSGSGQLQQDGFVQLSEGAVLVTAIKKAEQRDSVIIRLFESSGRGEQTHLKLPHYGIEKDLSLKPYEIKTLELDPNAKTLSEAMITEEPLSSL
jgi:alpha-mannosidase